MTEPAISASATTGPSLGLALIGNPPAVQATRLGKVPQGFWLQLLGEWGSDGDRPGEQVLLPLERLLSNMAWLRTACQRYGVGIVSTPDLDSILQQTRAQRRLLQSALAAPHPLDDAAVAGRERLALVAMRFRAAAVMLTVTTLVVGYVAEPLIGQSPHHARRCIRRWHCAQRLDQQ